MTNLSVIILIRDEELHLRRCLERLMPLEPRQIFLVDSPSVDRGPAIVRQFADEVRAAGGRTAIELVDHPWPGLQSVQFNWALDHLPIEGEWVLRLDADEYLTDDSVAWLKVQLADIEPRVAALELTLERKFMGGVIRHGTNAIKMVRMFRKGKGRYAETLMDERIVFDGEKRAVPVTFYDDNLHDLAWWKEKHRGYAKREAEQALSRTSQDPRKTAYYRLPPYFRAVLYFCIRYFLKLGFLDGVAGWRWHFWQGLWYRWLVDREIAKCRGRAAD